MLTGFLLVIILLNISLTIMLYLRQSTRREEEKAHHIRMHIHKAIRHFNQDSERNLRLLEEKILELKALLKTTQQPTPPSPPKQKLSSFIQNAYTQGTSQRLSSAALQSQPQPQPNESQASQTFPAQQHSLPKASKATHPHRQGKTHKIARLIGEGKSADEIAYIMEISVSEVTLLTRLLKKQLHLSG